MTELSDGRYEIFIIDAEFLDEETMRLEVTMISGDERGAVVALRGPHLARDPLSLLGLPATLYIERGVPRVVLDTD